MNNETTKNRGKSTWKKWLSKPIPSSIIGSLFVWVLFLIFSYVDVRNDIKMTKTKVDSLVSLNNYHIKKVK
jgi:hypothetical protein